VTDPTTFADFSITNFDAFISPSRIPSNRSAPFEVIFPITFISLPNKDGDELSSNSLPEKMPALSS
jgi:hypothetical protein